MTREPNVLVSIRSIGTVGGDGWQERRPATDDDGIAEHAQLVDEAELERLRGQAGAADRDVLAGRVERRGDLLGDGALGEPGVALEGVERGLKTTFGSARQTAANAAPDSSSRGKGSASHTSIAS